MPDQLEQELINRELETYLNRRPQGVSLGGDLPPVPEPAMFRKQPIIISDQLRSAYQDLRGRYPEITGGIESIRSSPTTALTDDLFSSGYSPYGFRNMNVLGMHDRDKKEVYVMPQHPDDTPQRVPGTLAHEIAHNRGYRESAADRVGGLYRQLLGEVKEGDIRLPNESGKIDPRLQKRKK